MAYFWKLSDDTVVAHDQRGAHVSGNTEFARAFRSARDSSLACVRLGTPPSPRVDFDQYKALHVNALVHDVAARTGVLIVPEESVLPRESQSARQSSDPPGGGEVY